MTFKCPNCRGLGDIDEDQYNGRVSILCSCGYHETKDWSKLPRINFTDPIGGVLKEGDLMLSDKVKAAVEVVRQAKSKASEGLSDSEYNEFLEELTADAEGWTMELDERTKNEEGT